MKYEIKAYSIWHPGKRVDKNGNPHQEDNMFPAYGTATDSDRLFILCDGMGGHEAGEVASATVCEAMSKSVLAAAPDPEGNFSEEIFDEALSDAYDALDGMDFGTAGRKPGTTMTMLKLHSAGYLIAHMGDSRVYHIRPGKHAEDTHIIFRTEDHSLVNVLIKSGEITPEKALHHPKKNIILRAMQPAMETRPKADIHTGSDIRTGDYFYLCTDGMLENMDDRQLRYFFSEEAGDDANKVKLLLKATQENRDNHSAIIVHVLGVAGKGERSVVRCENRNKETGRRSESGEKRSNAFIASLPIALRRVFAPIFSFAPSKNQGKPAEPTLAPDTDTLKQ